MTIKAIKEKYENYGCDTNEVNKFVVYNDKEIGKMVIVVNCYLNYRDVVQIVSVADGKELLSDGRSRPCDNLGDDAIDVALEMIWDEQNQ